jgi:hypothetical protein
MPSPGAGSDKKTLAGVSEKVKLFLKLPQFLKKKPDVPSLRYVRLFFKADVPSLRYVRLFFKADVPSLR